MKLPKRRFLLPAFCLLIAIAAFLATPVEGPAVTRAESFVTLATYDGVITPVSAEYFHDALLSAQESFSVAVRERRLGRSSSEVSRGTMLRRIRRDAVRVARSCYLCVEVLAATGLITPLVGTILQM